MARYSARYSGIRARGMSGNIAIETEGDWDKLMAVVENLPVEMAHQVETGMYHAAQEYHKLLRKNFRTGGVRLGYVPSVSAQDGAYKRYKTKYGRYQNVLMLSGRVYRSITVLRTRRGNIAVGISRRDTSLSRTRLSAFETAYLLENGTGDSIAYPVFRDTFGRSDQFGGKRRILRFIRMNVSSHYKKRYGLNLKIR